MNEPAAVKRRRLCLPRRFSLRALMVFVLVTGGGLGYVVNSANRQRDTVAAIRAANGQLWYDFEMTTMPKGPSWGTIRIPAKNAQPKWPKWLVDRLGVDYFGSVNSVRLSSWDEALMARIGQLDRLENLTLTDQARLTDADLAPLGGLTWLKSVAFTVRSNEETHVTAQGLQALASSAGLERLNVGQLVDDDDDLRAISGLKNLKVLLMMGSPRLTDAGMVHLKGFVDLRDLFITLNKVTSAGLTSLSGMTHLERLNLNGTQVDSLEPIRHLAEINDLNLRNTPIDDAGLAPVEGFPRLVKLNIDGAKRVSDAGLAHLKGLTSLEMLQARETRITDAGLANLAGLSKLRELWLGDTSVKGEGLVHLKGLPLLANLDLGGTLIDDAAIELLLAIPTLERIDLNRTRITDTGLATIAKHPNLHLLRLGNTQITDAGLMQLAKMKKLQSIEASGPKVTPAGIKALLAAKPGLQRLAPSRSVPPAPPATGK